jgi:hypothetical protein
MALTVAALAACDGQGQGDLCNTMAGSAGNNDCQSGLVCTPRQAIVASPYGICCPVDLSTATASNCQTNGMSQGNPTPTPASTDGATDGNVTVGDAQSDAPDGSTE